MQTKTPSALWRIARLLKDRKRTIALLLFLVASGAGFDISVPIITQRLIDRLIAFFTEGGDAPVALLVFSAAAILSVTVASRIFQSFYSYNLFKMVTQLEDRIRHTVFEQYLRLQVLFHHGSSSGQIIGRIERGAIAVYNILFEILGQSLIPPLVIFPAVFAVIVFKSPLIALIVILPLPIYLIAVKPFTDRIYKIEQEVNEQFEEVSKLSYDVAANVLTVKKFSQEEAEAEQQNKLRGVARKTQYSSEWLWSITESIQTAVAAAGRIAVLIVSGFFVLKGQSTIGEFVLFVTLQNMAYTPMMQLSSIFPRLRRNISRAERMFEIFDEPVTVFDKPNAMSLPPIRKSIQFKNVYFRYHDNASWGAHDINVVIPAGKTVALVGRSGSGKTTFINLLLRSYDPQQGAILIDGLDLRDIARESLLNQTAVVPQEVDLFSRTIRENIAYGKPDVSDADVVHAATVALSHDFIMKTEKGYDTVVGERGIKLSGGERQRVGIARAVLRDPHLLILDEATSHLDTESEQLIMEATNNLIKNRTTIIIAHRLSTVIHADTILVFDDGRIDGIGNHEELLRTNTTYQKLHDLQFRDN